MRNCDVAVEEMRREYNRRRRLVVNGFRSLGFDCFEPYGAFYVFPSVKKFGMTSEEFCKALLQAQRVAVVPGSAFGDSGEGFIRVSYAYSQEDLKKAIAKIGAFVDTLK